jgi:hypothetical protein
VCSASDSGRVTNRRTLDPCEKIGAGAAFQFAAGISAKFRGILAAAYADNLEFPAAIRCSDQAAEAHRFAAQRGVPTDRGAARAVKHGKKRPLGGKRCCRVGVIYLRDKRTRGVIIVSRFDGYRTLTDGG